MGFQKGFGVFCKLLEVDKTAEGTLPKFLAACGTDKPFPEFQRETMGPAVENLIPPCCGACVNKLVEIWKWQEVIKKAQEEQSKYMKVLKNSIRLAMSDVFLHSDSWNGPYWKEIHNVLALACGDELPVGDNVDDHDDPIASANLEVEGQDSILSILDPGSPGSYDDEEIADNSEKSANLDESLLDEEVPHSGGGRQRGGTVSVSVASHKGHSCRVCGKSFKKKGGMMRHLRLHTHSGDEQFLCEVCAKGFSRSRHLKLHMSTHTNLKPFACPTCGKKFARGAYLRRHRLTHKKNDYLCLFCEKAYSRPETLKAHLFTHTREKPNFCKSCGKEFATISDLRKHTRAHHTNDRRYGCVFCSKDFVESSHLALHIRAHIHEKPFFCKRCNKEFAQRNSLKYHTMRKKKECC